MALLPNLLAPNSRPLPSASTNHATPLQSALTGPPTLLHVFISRYDGRMQTLYWHVEWSFPAAGCKATDIK